MSNKQWIGVDLDGTLAHYPKTEPGKWHFKWSEIGPPIPAMVARVRMWLARDIEVRIMTARVFPYIYLNPSFTQASEYRHTCLVSGEQFTVSDMLGVIKDYTTRHIGRPLNATCAKDWLMIEQWDDRAVQVVVNTGEPLTRTAEAISLYGVAQGG